jgi:HD-like signal output (HDOD) protein
MTSNLTTEEQLLLEKVVGSQINIPPQPSILLEIDRLIGKPANNLTSIGNLISRDVGLSAAIFRLVNSPFYKLPCRVTSIPKAITIIGLAQITNLIKGLALRKALSGQELAYERFWEHSEEIATLSSIIAGKQVSVCNIAMDQAYMAGLFHECGVPILMQRFPDYCKAFRLDQGNSWPDFREEDQHFNTDHMIVGYLVAKHWNLPDFICQAIRFHHERLSVDYAALTLVSILQMARHLHKRLHHLSDAEWPSLADQVFHEIGVSEEGAQEFMEDVLDTFNQR